MTVTITFEKRGEDTLMALVHSGLPILKAEEDLRRLELAPPRCSPCV